MKTTQGQFHRIKAQQREQDIAWVEEQRARDGDRLQQAIRHLRSRGYIVAPASRPGEWNCGLRRDVDSADLIALADRLGCPFERTIHERGRRTADDDRRRTAGRA